MLIRVETSIFLKIKQQHHNKVRLTIEFLVIFRSLRTNIYPYYEVIIASINHQTLFIILHEISELARPYFEENLFVST